MYKLIKVPPDSLPNVLRLSDNVSIPFADDNADYQAYLIWLAEGNTPLPADSAK